MTSRLRTILHQVKAFVGMQFVAREVGSAYWANRIWGRYPVSDFRRGSHVDSLFFVRLGIEAPRPAADILLARYAMALDLHIYCDAAFTIEKDILHVEIDGVRANVNTEEEVLILHELFIDRAYDWHMRPGTLIFDIGMNVGLASLFFARANGVRCIGFEPFSPTFEQARSNLALNAYAQGRVELYNIGLSDQDAAVEWDYSAQNRGSCGVYGVGPNDNSGSGNKVRVDLRRASRVVEETLTRLKPDILIAKIDCEGSEYAILRDLASSGLLGKFAGFMIEWHRRGGHEPSELDAILYDAGFSVIRQPHARCSRGMIYAFNDGYTSWTGKLTGLSAAVG